jgi:cation diffusion facilitator family transporter
VASTRLQRSLRATLIGMVVNGALAAVKLAAGLLGHSQALIADAVESLADIFSSVIVWRAVVVASTPADEDHPYGHGKAEPIAAAIVATMLLLAAVGIVLTSAQQVFAEEKRGPEPFTLAVLVLVVVIKEGLFRVVHREAKSLDSTVVSADAWHHRSDAITSFAAAIGISIAVIGGEGYEVADDVAAIVAAGLIAWNGWRLLRPALDELMDTAPELATVTQVREVASSVPGVLAVEKCIVRKMGYQHFVDMHVEVDPLMTVSDAHVIAHRVKDTVRRQIPTVFDVLVHIEPGVPRP